MAQVEMIDPRGRRRKSAGRPKGSKDSRPRRPDFRLNAVLTAIRVADAAGFDLSVDKTRGIVLTPKPPAETVEPDGDNAKESVK